MKRRQLSSFIQQDLAKKMVFIAGPRQVGKTTLAKEILQTKKNGTYYNWDNRTDRRQVLDSAWPTPPALIVLDEFHKYRTWKRWLKGEYDQHQKDYQFLITGSARLDVYRKGGDSLQGRYHHYRLHPFSLSEILNIKPKLEIHQKLHFKKSSSEEILTQLLKFSGFPEPFTSASSRTHRRWQKERLDRFFREDVRDLENIRDMASMELLADLLPSRVASPLSLNSLREDLEVSHRAITHWMNVLEKLYFAYRIRPYTSRMIRGLKKEPKAYLWDWSLVDDPGARFENLIASHLLKLCHFLEDTEGYPAELFYLRDVDKREVDFLVTIKRKPWFAVEAKLSASKPAPQLRYFGDRLKIPALYQVTLEDSKEFVQDGVHVLPAKKFLTALP